VPPTATVDHPRRLDQAVLRASKSRFGSKSSGRDRASERRSNGIIEGRLVVAVPVDRADNQNTQAWEYMTFDLTKPKKDIVDLNRLGREGWEAVSMVSSWGVGWRWVHPIVLLRRPLAA
jgi:hypothetical protein